MLSLDGTLRLLGATQKLDLLHHHQSVWRVQQGQNEATRCLHSAGDWGPHPMPCSLPYNNTSFLLESVLKPKCFVMLGLSLSLMGYALPQANVLLIILATKGACKERLVGTDKQTVG